MIAISVVKQHAWDADPRAIQQINFLANLDSTENTTMFFIVEEAKRKRLFTKNCKGIVNVPQNNLTLINIKMPQYNSSNVKLSNPKLNKLKYAIKQEAEAVLRLASNIMAIK